MLSLLLLMACAPVPRSRAVLREFQKLHPCPATGKTTGACPGYVKDHIDPLCHTGVKGDRVDNIQWETIADAKVKDAWERQLCAKQCHP
jgi:hypothetical protein